MSATFAAARSCHEDWDMVVAIFGMGRKLVRCLTGMETSLRLKD
jgi:hypothetical protein